jgi:hypothetical protein
MDIAGAKALKQRLGQRGREERPPGSADVAEHAPPVYHYLGVSQGVPEAAATVPDDAPAGRGRSLLRRLLWLSD